MCVVLIGFEVFFYQACSRFSERFPRLQRLMSLLFKTSMSSISTFQRLQTSFVFTFQDFNAFCLYISKTSNVFCLYISRFQCLVSLHFKTSLSFVFTFQDSNVFYLYISRLQCLLFCFARLQRLLFSTFDTSFIYSFLKVSLPWFSLVANRTTRSLE